MNDFINYAMLYIGALTVLVTFLVGWQIYQSLSVEYRIRKASMKETRKIARDLAHIFTGIRLLNTSLAPEKHGEEMQRVDILFNAIEELVMCKEPTISQIYLDETLLALKRRFERMQSKGGLRVLQGKKYVYIITLKAVHSPYQPEVYEYLYNSKERHPSYDTEILTSDDEETVILHEHV